MSDRNKVNELLAEFISQEIKKTDEKIPIPRHDEIRHDSQEYMMLDRIELIEPRYETPMVINC